MYNQLIQRWLAARAMEAVQGALLNELRTPGTEPERADCADRSAEKQKEEEGYAIGMVFAVPMEAAGVVDLLSEAQTTKANGLRYHTGHFAGYRVALVESGMGQERAVAATGRLLEMFKPVRILSAGYAGGLVPEMSREKLVLPSRLVRETKDGGIETIDLPGGDAEKITLLTADRVVRTPAEKRALGKRFQADLVDMETFAIAQLCRKKEVPFLSLRIVLDTASEEVAKEVQKIVDSGGGPGSTARMLGSVFGALMKRPSSLLDLYQLKERALVATDKLAKGIEQLLKETYPEVPPKRMGVV